MKAIILGLLITVLCAEQGQAYSVLTHEAIIDAAWDTSIVPLLLQRFPQTSLEELVAAHAYAYGGSIIQDMGYYPFGSHFFSDLVHYVRSGDFILRLIRNSGNVNEYAFSLGALAHYAADNNGHRLATNRAVPLLYPKLRMKFGDTVTYADDAVSHVKTEFAFDVLQVAQGHYAPEGYHNFIGFEVAKDLLDRTVVDIYGLKLQDLVLSENLAIGSYRRAVSSTIPAMTRVAWQMKKGEILRDAPTLTRQKFLYNLSRSNYRKTWGAEYREPGLGSRLLAWVFRIAPRVGSSRSFAFVTPTPAVENLFLLSFNSTLDRYRQLLAAQQANRLTLPNENFDTGTPSKAGSYTLSDRAYAKLLEKVNQHPDIPAELRDDILAFYKDADRASAAKANPKEWEQVQAALGRLQTNHK